MKEAFALSTCCLYTEEKDPTQEGGNLKHSKNHERGMKDIKSHGVPHILSEGVMQTKNKISFRGA